MRKRSERRDVMEMSDMRKRRLFVLLFNSKTRKNGVDWFVESKEREDNEVKEIEGNETFHFNSIDMLLTSEQLRKKRRVESKPSATRRERRGTIVSLYIHSSLFFVRKRRKGRRKGKLLFRFLFSFVFESEPLFRIQHTLLST